MNTIAKSASLKPCPPGAARAASRPTIMLVDDNRQNVELLEAFLADLDASVRVARDGAEALLKTEQYRPDLIVLDVMMPRMSGFQVCRTLKANPATRSIPILMLTALHEFEDVKTACEAGTDDFVSKPVGKTEFIARVERLLGGTGVDGDARYDRG